MGIHNSHINTCLLKYPLTDYLLINILLFLWLLQMMIARKTMGDGVDDGALSLFQFIYSMTVFTPHTEIDPFADAVEI